MKNPILLHLSSKIFILMLFLALNINVSYAQYKKINFIPSISIDDNNFSESSTLQYTSKIVKEKENNTIYFNWIIKEKSPCFFILEKSFDGGYNYIELRVLIKDKDINIDEPIFYCYNEENKNDVSNILFRLKQINYDQIGNIIFGKFQKPRYLFFLPLLPRAFELS